jgi:hypothetical protein
MNAVQCGSPGRHGPERAEMPAGEDQDTALDVLVGLVD